MEDSVIMEIHAAISVELTVFSEKKSSVYEEIWIVTVASTNIISQSALSESSSHRGFLKPRCRPWKVHKALNITS